MTEQAPPPIQYSPPSVRTLMWFTLLLFAVWYAPREFSYWYLAAAQNAQAAEAPDKALAYARQALRWTPKLPLPHAILAKLLHHQKNYEDAVTAYDNALALDIGNYRLQLNKICLLHEMGKLDEKIQEMRAKPIATEQDIREKIAFAEQLAAINKTAEALELLTKIQSDSKVMQQVHIQRFLFLQELNHHDNAAQVYALLDAESQTTVQEQYLFTCLHLQRYSEMLEIMHRSENEWQLDKLWNLQQIVNNHAYFRAVANVEIELAQKQVTQILSSATENNASFLDTRGYLHYRQYNYGLALTDLNKAVLLSELEMAEWQRKTTTAATHAMQLEILKQPVEKSLQRSHAVICYHRALVYEAMGDSAKAAADRALVKSMGFVPNESLF
jgi:tetratricopeptide (TPR) repeat protein